MFPEEQPPAVPFDEDAEESAIGAVLINPDAFYEVDILPDHFYITRNAWIWAAISALIHRKVNPDYVTLCNELNKDGKLGEIGGPAHLTAMINRVPSSLYIADYVDIVKDMAARRKMIISAHNLVKGAYDYKRTVTDTSGTTIADLSSINMPRGGAVHVKEYLDPVYDTAVERKLNPSDLWGFSTGFKDVDRLTGGGQRKETWYIAGEPGVGKSKLALSLAKNLAKQNLGVVVYSVEMGGESFARRLWSADSKIPTRLIKNGSVHDNDWAVLTHSFERLCDDKFPFYLSDKSGLTLGELRADLARMKQQYGIVAFVVDYLLIMGGTGGMDDNERSAYLSGGIQEIVKTFDLWGITVNSVTKDVMDTRKAKQSGMRGSSQVIHDADVIAFLTRHIAKDGEVKRRNVVTWTFVKGREIDHIPAAVDLYAHPDYPDFSDLEIRKVDLSKMNKTEYQDYTR